MHLRLSLAAVLALLGCSPTEGHTVVPDSSVTDTTDDTEWDALDADDLGEADGHDAADADTGMDVTDGSMDVDATGDADGSDVDDSAGGDASDGAVWPAAVLSKAGTAGKVVLKGMIVTPDTAFAGEVLVVGNTIACAAASCAATAGYADASVVETNGIVLPGLIDTHNHILYDIFDETDWAPTKAYAHHDEWPAEARYSAMVDAKQWLNGESGPLPRGSYGCEMLKYGELKGIVAGTTSILGTSGTAKKCFASLARSVDTKYDGLTSADTVQVATLWPGSTAQSVCDKMLAAPPTIDAYFVHIGEGTNDKARLEFTALGALTTPAECLFRPATTITHGTAFLDAELTKMAATKMSLTWSPRSNVYLYGGGTDLTKTTDIPTALAKGINVAVSPDWSMGGSQNMLDELRFADRVDDTVWGNKLSPKMLLTMATVNAAKALHRDTLIGSIEVGKRADLMVIAGDPAKPYDSLLAARPRDVRLTMIDGVALYGDPALVSLGPSTPGCETIDVCSASKFLCVATTTATDKLDQSYKTIVDTLAKALADYDALALTTWKFTPITPLVRCP